MNPFGELTPLEAYAWVMAGLCFVFGAFVFLSLVIDRRRRYGPPRGRPRPKGRRP